MSRAVVKATAGKIAWKNAPGHLATLSVPGRNVKSAPRSTAARRMRRTTASLGVQLDIILDFPLVHGHVDFEAASGVYLIFRGDRGLVGINGVYAHAVMARNESIIRRP